MNSYKQTKAGEISRAFVAERFSGRLLICVNGGSIPSEGSFS